MDAKHEQLIAALRATVDDALAEIDALLAEAGEDGPPEPTAPALAAIGGPDLDLRPRDGFLSEGWRRGYQPARERGVYVASCSGLRGLQRRFGVDLAKPGTVDAHSLETRLNQIRRDRTGSCFFDGTRYLRSANGWTDWFARQIRPSLVPSPGSPVRVDGRLLRFRLPATLYWQDFDDSFDARLRVAALDRWAMSEQGLARCAERQLSPRFLQRSTPYGGGVEVRLSPATEICLFDPVAGPDRLIRIVEDVLLAHVLGAPA